MMKFQAHTGSIHSLQFAPSGESLASAGADGMIRLWDGICERMKFDPASGAINSLAFNRSSTMLASGGSDKTVRLWDLEKLALTATLPACTHAIQGLGFILDDKQLAIGVGEPINHSSVYHGLLFWNLDTSKQVQHAFLESAGIRSLTVHESNLIAWASTKDHHTAARLYVRDLRKSSTVPLVHPHESRSLAISPDGKTLAVASDWKIYLFDLTWKRDKAIFTGHRGVVSSLVFSPDGTQLISGSWDETVRMWDLATGKESKCYQWKMAGISAVAIASDGLRAAASSKTGLLCIWDMDH